MYLIISFPVRELAYTLLIWIQNTRLNGSSSAITLLLRHSGMDLRFGIDSLAVPCSKLSPALPLSEHLKKSLIVYGLDHLSLALPMTTIYLIANTSIPLGARVN